MKLINWFKHIVRGHKNTEQTTVNDYLSRAGKRKKDLEIADEEQRTRYVISCCEQIVDTAREEETAKEEYQLVTSYLTDIQEMEKLPLEEKAELTDIVRKIVVIDSEREKYKSTNNVMTDAQYYKVERYEDEIPDTIKRIKKNEEYQMLVKKDLQHLEGEKGSYSFRKDEIINEQRKMKEYGRIFFSTVSIIFIGITIANIVLGLHLILPIIIFAFISLLLTLGAFIKNYRNEIEIQTVSANLNRIILLSNKIKIKYVNVTNLLEYLYEKHGVNSAYELQFLWERYLEAKSMKQRYKKTTDDLELYHKKLINTLRKYNVKDPNFWVHRSIAIIDKKEMVEVRHELNTRRQILRKNIEFYQNNMNEIKDEVKGLVKEYPEYAKEILNIVDSF